MYEDHGTSNFLQAGSYSAIRNALSYNALLISSKEGVMEKDVSEVRSMEKNDP